MKADDITVTELAFTDEIVIAAMGDYSKTLGVPARRFVVTSKARRADDNTQFLKTSRYITLEG